MAETYIPQLTLACPDPPVYYTIRGAFTLKTASDRSCVLPRVVSVLAEALRPFCVLDGITALVRIVYPPNVNVKEYEIFIYFPRAIRTYASRGAVVPVCLPQLEDQCVTLAEQLTVETEPGGAVYEAMKRAANARSDPKDAIQSFTFAVFEYTPYTPPVKGRACCPGERTWAPCELP